MRPPGQDFTEVVARNADCQRARPIPACGENLGTRRWIRTTIASFRARCPAIERSRQRVVGPGGIEPASDRVRACYAAITSKARVVEVEGIEPVSRRVKANCATATPHLRRSGCTSVFASSPFPPWVRLGSNQGRQCRVIYSHPRVPSHRPKIKKAALVSQGGLRCAVALVVRPTVPPPAWPRSYRRRGLQDPGESRHNSRSATRTPGRPLRGGSGWACCHGQSNAGLSCSQLGTSSFHLSRRSLSICRTRGLSSMNQRFFSSFTKLTPGISPWRRDTSTKLLRSKTKNVSPSSTSQSSSVRWIVSAKGSASV